MKQINKFLYLAITVLVMNSCTEEIEPLETAFVTFEKNAMDITVDPGSQTEKEIKIYSANTTGSDRTFEVDVITDETEVDAAAYIVPTSFTIPAGTNTGILNVTLNDVNLSLLDQKLVLRIKNSENLFVGDDLVLAASQNCVDAVKVKITLGFDNWPEEVYWRIKDASGATVWASSPTPAYGAYAGFSGSLTTPQCLTSGDYTMEIFDQYGDGGTSYSITGDGTPLGVVSASDYAGSTSISFSI